MNNLFRYYGCCNIFKPRGKTKHCMLQFHREIAMVKSDILQPCCKESLCEILKILKKRLPHEIRAFNTIYNYFYHYDRINGQRHHITSDRWNVTFYQLKECDLENCTIISISGLKDYTIGLFTLQKSSEELLNSLEETKLIKWHNPSIQFMCDEQHFKVVEPLITSKTTNWDFLPVECVMNINKEIIEHLKVKSLPANVYLAPLQADKHASIINDTWPYKAGNSLELIRTSILFNGGTGVFRKDREQPVGWVVTNDFLTPGFLYVDTTERRQGYGKVLVVAELKRLCHQHHMDMYTVVSIENLISLKLHDQLGFRKVNGLRWMVH